MSSDLATALSSQKDLYMNLLMAQLQNQDPMEPMSNSEMVSQMAQLATLDSMGSLNTSFGEVLELHRLASGTGMIGREVSYSNDGEILEEVSRSIANDGEIEQDTVESVSVNEGAITLQLAGGGEIALNNIRSVSQAQEN